MRRVLFLIGVGLWLAAAQPCLANDVSLDRVIASGDDVSLTIPHIEFADANIDAKEARALFDPNTPADDRKAILGKLTASKVTAPSLTYVFKGGTIALSDFEADHVAAGKAAHLALSGGALRQTDARGELDLTLRALAADDVDLTRLLAASARKPRPDDVRAAHVVSSGFSALFTPTGDADLERFGALAIDLRNFETHADYQGSNLVESSSTFDHLTFTPAAGSAGADALKQFGYSSLDVSGSFEGSYDPEKQVYSIKRFDLNGAGMAHTTISGAISGVAPGEADASVRGAPRLLLDGQVQTLSLHLVDEGLVGHLVDFYASRQDATPDQVRRQWSAAAALMIPMLMRGDSASLVIAQAVSQFIRSPGIFDVSLKAKGDPVSFADLWKAIGDGGLSSKIEIEAQATHK